MPPGKRERRLMETKFQHEAVFYFDEDGFLAGTLPFVRAAIAADEPILVAVDQPKIERLTKALGEDASRVRFRDMIELGRNPARIIAAWCDFVAEHRDNGTALRGIGEPAWPGRSDAEIEECHHHESLLNLAFADGPEFTLVCPYEVHALELDAIHSALATHPTLRVNGTRFASGAYVDPAASAGPFAGELPPPPSAPEELRFAPGESRRCARFAFGAAERLGAEPRKARALAAAVNELAANSVRHAGAGGSVRVWREEDALLGEVSGGGRIADPLAGRLRPAPSAQSGRGLWLVNQLCELVQIRSSAAGTVVRVRLALA